jgi:hypothetical protein
MSFLSDVQKFAAKVEDREKRVFDKVADHLHRSMTVGSETTGAAGQPVKTGNLINSFHPEYLGKFEWQDTTNVEYAPDIEHNARGATLQSEVGGFHSLADTVGGFKAIVREAVDEVRSGQ